MSLLECLLQLHLLRFNIQLPSISCIYAKSFITQLVPPRVSNENIWSSNPPQPQLSNYQKFKKINKKSCILLQIPSQPKIKLSVSSITSFSFSFSLSLSIINGVFPNLSITILNLSYLP